MKLTEKQIKEELKELRNLIDSPDTDDIERIVAYGIECAVRFILEDTSWKNDVGYSLVYEAKDTAGRIYDEL